MPVIHLAPNEYYGSGINQGLEETYMLDFIVDLFAERLRRNRQNIIYNCALL